MSVCPFCNSPNTQKLSIMHQSGVSTGTAVGVGLNKDGLGVGVAATTQQTALSKSAAPPKSNSFGSTCFATGCLFIPMGLFLALFNGRVALFWMLGFTVIAWSLPFIFKEHTAESAAKDAEAQGNWDNTAMCLSCGKKFQLY